MIQHPLPLVLACAVATLAAAPRDPAPPADAGGHHAAVDAGTPAMAAAGGPSGRLAETGQDAFAALAEAAAWLERDPDTDWSSARLLALREHLVDMHHVTLLATVEERPVAGGFVARVTGSGRTLAAIRRLAGAHLSQVAGEGLRVEARELADGVELEITGAGPRAEARLRGLGFYGFLTAGDHHRRHHLAIAQGRRRH